MIKSFTFATPSRDLVWDAVAAEAEAAAAELDSGDGFSIIDSVGPKFNAATEYAWQRNEVTVAYMDELQAWLKSEVGVLIDTSKASSSSEVVAARAMMALVACSDRIVERLRMAALESEAQTTEDE